MKFILTALDSIYKHYDRTFSFLISSFIIFATFASILFGIHAGVLSKYEDPKFGEQGLYNWFNPKDIIKFPVNQLKYAQNNNEPRAIDDEDVKEPNENIAYSFILDKTSSIDINTQQLNAIKSDIVNRNENGLTIESLKKFELTDLISLSMLWDIRKKRKTLNDNSHFNNSHKAMIFCVDGDTVQVLKPISGVNFEYKNILDNAPFNDIVNGHIDFVNRQTAQPNQVTNLSQMFKDLDAKISSDNNNVSKDYHVITIISDFKNEGTDDIVNILKKAKFAQKNFQLNLIRLKAKNDNDSSSTKTLKKLHELFSKTIFLYNIDIQDLDNHKLLVSLIEELSTPCSSKIRNIELFTPTVSVSSNGMVELEQLKNSFKQNGDLSKYIFTYINRDIDKKSIDVTISQNGKDHSFKNKHKQEIELDKNDTIDFIMSGNQDIKYPVIFDIYNKTKGYKQRIRFWIMPKLSKTVAQLHLILVTGAIASLTLFFSFLVLFYGSPNVIKSLVYNFKDVPKDDKYKAVIALVFLLITFGYCFYGIRLKDEWYIIVEIIIVCVISILIALYDEYKSTIKPTYQVRYTN
jgi:hypothetical protein